MQRERFADKVIQQLSNDFNSYKDEVNSFQIEVSGHIQQFERHTAAEDDKWRQVIALGQENKYSIKELRTDLRALESKTSELVTLNTRFKSVGWFASTVSKIIGWGAGLILAATIVYNTVIGK